MKKTNKSVISTMDDVFEKLRIELRMLTTEELRNMMNKLHFFYNETGKLRVDNLEDTPKLIALIQDVPKIYFHLTEIIKDELHTFSDDLNRRDINLIGEIVNEIIIDRANLQLFDRI